MIPERFREESRLASIPGGDCMGGGKKYGREGEAGKIMIGCIQKWGPFQNGARQGGVS